MMNNFSTLNFSTFFPNIDMHIIASQGITFGIKIQIDNQAPFVSTFREEGMTLDSTLATCLSPVFSSQTIQTYGLKIFNPDLPSHMGHFIEGVSPAFDTSYAGIEYLDMGNAYLLDPVSAPVILVAHSPKVLAYNFNRSIAPPPEYENNPDTWVAHIESMTDSQRTDLYTTELNKKIINEKHMITFLPKSNTDDYLDLFEVLLKSQKVNKPITQFSLTPASVQNDKIVFTSLCQVQNLSLPPFK